MDVEYLSWGFHEASVPQSQLELMAQGISVASKEDLVGSGETLSETSADSDAMEYSVMKDSLMARQPFCDSHANGGWHSMWKAVNGFGGILEATMLAHRRRSEHHEMSPFEKCWESWSSGPNEENHGTLRYRTGVAAVSHSTNTKQNAGALSKIRSMHLHSTTGLCGMRRGRHRSPLTRPIHNHYKAILEAESTIYVSSHENCIGFTLGFPCFIRNNRVQVKTSGGSVDNILTEWIWVHFWACLVVMNLSDSESGDRKPPKPESKHREIHWRDGIGLDSKGNQFIELNSEVRSVGMERESLMLSVSLSGPQSAIGELAFVLGKVPGNEASTGFDANEWG
ncbi:uncharacterized protein BDR25DRAFT_351415 [Lindgomyces ingoldianus]|uniref:Uncharacterized protein n=1 Tax=Lindgomyces ingoldianus TaxID=673940 RepID=A0ACB6R6L1_9PLEO|nr:uncharacterized protein BDR25DRAFT_351415 [Lindgomyces ingoldianus]KAF2474933.1 hypothetical protein BDR25DRAFT_351415 [Lindgomyces ingoldianus]